MTDMTSQAGGARHQHDGRARAAIEAKIVKVALIALVVLVAALAVLGVVVDLMWR